MPEPTTEVLERAERIDLILLDVDGVLTDGRLYMDGRGGEMKAFHTRDGLGIRIGQRGGLLFGIVTGRESTVVRDRAEELYITEIHQRVQDKGAKVAEILARVGIHGERACFVGDDVVDLPAMRRCGLAVAPADASPEAIAAAHYVTSRRGGDGCVRETIDLVLRAKGKWESVTERFFRDD